MTSMQDLCPSKNWSPSIFLYAARENTAFQRGIRLIYGYLSIYYRASEFSMTIETDQSWRLFLASPPNGTSPAVLNILVSSCRARYHDFWSVLHVKNSFRVVENFMKYSKNFFFLKFSKHTKRLLHETKPHNGFVKSSDLTILYELNAWIGKSRLVMRKARTNMGIRARGFYWFTFDCTG